MSATEVSTLIKLRSDTASNWTQADPVLEKGELGFEYDTFQFKIGNGSDCWNDITNPYLVEVEESITISDKIVHRGDDDTAIRFPDDDQFSVETAGVSRLLIDSGGKVAIGEVTTLDATLKIKGGSDSVIKLDRETSSASYVAINADASSADDYIGGISFEWNGTEVAGVKARAGDDTSSKDDGHIVFETASSGTPLERMRVNRTGNVLIGATSPRTTTGTLQPYVQIEGTGGTTASLSILRKQSGSTDPSRIQLAKSRGGSAGVDAVESGDKLGTVEFLGADGSALFSAAQIRAVAAADGASSSVPGKLEFWTTTSGNSGPSRRMSIDDSGRLLVGTVSSVATGFNQGANIQIFDDTGSFAVRRGADNEFGPTLALGKSRGTSDGTFSASTIVQDDDSLGAIRFTGDDGVDFQTQGAKIEAFVDGTPGTDDMPGRLSFFTTPDGASSPTERMTIYSTGQILCSHSTNGTRVLRVDSNSTTYNDSTIQTSCDRGASTAYNFFKALSNNGADQEFRLRGDGNAYADGSWNGGGADYAEYFEWSDGNSASEDRRGISVVLDGDKIREAVAGEEPIGVISGNPSVVGDADIDRWKGKYLRDDYGTYTQENYEVEDDDGNIVVQHRRVLNPDYDPDVEYISREDRAEWDCVGLMGKLRIRKGQVTGSRWIKMRDISDSVEEWLVR